MPNGISHPYQLDESISNLRVYKLIQILKEFFEANSAEPEQMCLIWLCIGYVTHKGC